MPSVGPCPRPLANRRLADLLEFGEEVCGVWGNQHPSNHPAGAYCLNRSVDEEKDHILRLPLMVLRADEDILTSVMNDDDRRLAYARPLLAIACWHRPGGKQQPESWAGWMESRGVKTRAQQRGVPAEPPAMWSVAGGIWARFKKAAAMKRPPLREVVAIVDELRGALLALRTRSELEVLAAQVAGHDTQLAGHDAQLKQMQQRLVTLEAAGGAIMPRRAGRFSEPSVLVLSKRLLLPPTSLLPTSLPPTSLPSMSLMPTSLMPTSLMPTSLMMTSWMRPRSRRSSRAPRSACSTATSRQQPPAPAACARRERRWMQRLRPRRTWRRCHRRHGQRPLWSTSPLSRRRRVRPRSKRLRSRRLPRRSSL